MTKEAVKVPLMVMQDGNTWYFNRTVNLKDPAEVAVLNRMHVPGLLFIGYGDE